MQAKRLRSCRRIDLSVGETTCRRNDRFPDKLHLPLLVSDHPSTTLQITVLFLTQTQFKKLFRKLLRPLLRPEIWLIPLFTFLGSDHTARSCMIRKPWLECHKSSIPNSAHPECWQIHRSNSVKKKEKLTDYQDCKELSFAADLYSCWPEAQNTEVIKHSRLRGEAFEWNRLIVNCKHCTVWTRV